MNIYQLTYDSKEQAVNDLKSKGVLLSDTEGGTFYGPQANGVHAVVYLGFSVETDATYDEQGNELTPAVLSSSYDVDIMCEVAYSFNNTISPNTARHGIKWKEGTTVNP